ncbi:IS256 family transposase [Rubellimicrobium mesophilum]|nr:IS256 family transposase [Rubellimicrobium mesophilum]
MTDDRMALMEALQKADDGNFLRSLAETVLQILMEADVEGLIGAGRYERSGERSTWRNGYRDRSLDTRLGPLNLRIPKLRTGSYFPPFLEARKTTEKALVSVIQEAWVAGVSTRKVDDLVQAMGLSGISKSQVSKLCKEIDERVGAFLKRPLEGEWPYLWLDATYLKVREGGRIVSVAAIIAVAANRDGRREIVGLHIGPSEAETFWATFLKDLVRRGLRGVRLVISDAHEGLKAAIQRVIGATWQRCRVHFMRNALAHVSKGQHTVVAAAIRQAFLQPDHKAASETWRHVADQLRVRWPKLGALMDQAEADVLAYMTFPSQHRVKLHSTNPLERLNKEVKRRADVVGIFPNEESIIRLIGAVLLEQNDEWQLQHRYMQVEAMAELDVPPTENPTLISTEAA